MRQRFRLLAENPHIGTRRPELGAAVRALAVGNYLIVYRPESDGVTIVHVVHGARDLPPLFAAIDPDEA